MKKYQLFFIIVFEIIFCSCFSQNKEFYVSPLGNDNNSGTKEQPFLSFNRAWTAVVETVTKGAKGQEIQVFFRGGSYFFGETAILKDANLAKGDNKVVFSSYQNEKVVFSAGIKIFGWTKLTDEIPFLPDKSKNKVWVTDIPEGQRGNIARFLCNNSGMLPNAVSDALYTAEDDTARLAQDKFISAERLSSFVFPKASFRKWDNLQDIEIITIPHYGWTMNILSLKFLDMDKGIAYTTIPATYKICRLENYDKPNLWVQNAIDFLDEPGEWVINSSTGKIYYWPNEKEPGEVYYPSSKEIIRIEGNRSTGELAKNIEFRGITFAHADRDSWKYGDIGLQHDWAMFNKSDALLQFVNAENCIVNHCTFTNSGGNGVRFDLYSQNNTIKNCEFFQLGGTAILLSGYGPGHDDLNKDNLIENNEIHDCGQEYWHSPGIFLWQSGGNLIAHNLIYNMPYTGIVVSGPRPQFFNTRMGNRRELTGTFNYNNIENFEISGNDWDHFTSYIDTWDNMFKYLFAKDNVIEYNELHHTTLKIDDGNGIYLSGTGYNNIVRRNYIHDNISSCLHGIIRADDQAKDVTITQNIIYRYTGEGIKIKHPCMVTNNYIINWIPSELPNVKHVSMRDFINASPAGPIKGSIIKYNICYQSCGLTQPFFGVSRYYPLGKLTKTSDINMNNNLYYATGTYNDCIRQLNEHRIDGVDINSMVADPLFEGLEEAGFKLNQNSPAFILGIQQIDFENVGLKSEKDN